MGWDLITPLAKVDLGAPEGVERITLVGVDNNHEKTRVSMDQLALVASLQIPEDRSIVEEGQVDHVLALLKLGRVDTAHVHCLQARNISFILYFNEFYKAVLIVPNRVIMPT